MSAEERHRKSKSPRKDAKKRAHPVAKETNIQDGRQQSAEAKSLAREMNGDVVSLSCSFQPASSPPVLSFFPPFPVAFEQADTFASV